MRTGAMLNRPVARACVTKRARNVRFYVSLHVACKTYSPRPGDSTLTVMPRVQEAGAGERRRSGAAAAAARPVRVAVAAAPATRAAAAAGKALSIAVWATTRSRTCCRSGS